MVKKTKTALSRKSYDGQHKQSIYNHISDKPTDSNAAFSTINLQHGYYTEMYTPGEIDICWPLRGGQYDINVARHFNSDKPKMVFAILIKSSRLTMDNHSNIKVNMLPYTNIISTSQPSFLTSYIKCVVRERFWPLVTSTVSCVSPETRCLLWQRKTSCFSL